MKSKNSDFDHAEHNYALHKKLLEIGTFDDWVITTGFYAGMKFLQSALFPGKYICPSNQVFTHFATFADYIKANRTLNKANAHSILENVIEQYIDNVAVKNSYKDLKNECFYARYRNYNVGKNKLHIAIEAIEIIRDFHQKNKSNVD